MVKNKLHTILFFYMHANQKPLRFTFRLVTYIPTSTGTNLIHADSDRVTK